ncbi:MAG: YdeI/OmpD-associated family protein [Leptospirillum sp.]
MATPKDETKTKADQDKERQIMSFESAKDWERWLARNHELSSGIWLQIQKKDSGRQSLSYAEALDVALCYGWIDGQKKPNDDRSWHQKFTRRVPKSGWSKKNTEHVERLTKAGKMKPAGLAAVEAAKKDGLWKSAYDSQGNSKIPEDFLNALGRDKKAEAFFNSLNKANLYSIAYRLQTAKNPETRERRMRVILEMMAEGKKFHP